MKKEEHILICTSFVCILIGLISGGLATNGYFLLPLIMVGLVWLISLYIIYQIHKDKNNGIKK